MKKQILVFIKVFLLLSAANVVSQNIKIDDSDHKLTQNSLTVHLAATKLCSSFYAQNDLNRARSKKSSYKGYDKRSRFTSHVCVETIKQPFNSPLESFADRFLKDKRIVKNQSNVFKLRELRNELKNTYLADYETMVDSIDPENLVFYKYDLIKDYSFDTGKMLISLWKPKLDYLLPHATSNSNLIQYPMFIKNDINNDAIYLESANLGDYYVPMSEEKAQEIYANYSNYRRPNPPFAIGTKIHYALRLGEAFAGEPRYYQVVFKKVEFFLPSPDNIKGLNSYKLLKDVYKGNNKIAEIIVEDKIYRTAKGQAYQKYVSIK